MPGCDEWTGGVGKNGYGNVYVGGGRSGRQQIGAHRLAWMQEHGHTDLWILHKCGNRLCVTVEHLYAGTPTDNNRDTVTMGRHVQWNKPTNLCEHGGSKRYCKECRARR